MLARRGTNLTNSSKTLIDKVDQLVVLDYTCDGMLLGIGLDHRSHAQTDRRFRKKPTTLEDDVVSGGSKRLHGATECDR